MRYRYRYRDQIFEINLERTGEGYRAVLEGISYQLEVLNDQPGQISLLFDGRPVTLYWAVDEEIRWVSLFGCAYPLEKPVPSRSHLAGGQEAEAFVRAPMPAQVRSLEVEVGDPVERGDTLMLLEAMKMEIRIRAPKAGRIAAIRVTGGQTVNRDDVLVELES
jgi:acetyl/propionyl-CoA carboxylase alpha subunit